MRRVLKRKRLRRRPARAARSRKPQAPVRQDAKDGGVVIGGAHDPAEKAADRAAAQALAGGPVTVGGASGFGSAAASTPSVHRECQSCSEGKDEEVRRSGGTGGPVAGGAYPAKAGADASSAIRSMGAGKPLDAASRAFFEPRFDRDFSSVRVHDGPAADKAARSVDARAFAWGRDIAFGSGERERGGMRLLAHELAHVAQDSGGGEARRTVRRATLQGSDGPGDFKAVPAAHHAEVNRALDLVQNAIRETRCRNYFRDNCTVGTLTSAQDALDNAKVYYLPDHTGRFGLSDLPDLIAYNRYSFDVGRWEIAATLLHEMFHTCDTTIDSMDEILAEGSNEACGFYSPWILDATPLSVNVGDTIDVNGFGLGPTQDSRHYLELGGRKITRYSNWAQSSASDIEVSFKVPAFAGPTFFSEDHQLVAVNHGVRSNIKTVTVNRF